MENDNEKLASFYKAAKKRRVVLNMTEFAKKLGYSREHIYHLMSSDATVRPQTLAAAEALAGTPVIKLSMMEDEMFTERSERAIAREAIIRVMAQKMKELEHAVTKRPLTEVSLDFDRAVEREVKRSLDEWLKRSS